MVYEKEPIKFSVLIPVYNVENHLSECLESVLKQTYSNFEVIITNDGSTDRSSDICTEYAAIDDRISIYHQENKGLLMARRNSITNSTGDYYLFLDSDDTWKLDTLEKVYKTIIETNADMVIFNWDRLKGDEVIPSKSISSNENSDLNIPKIKIVEKFITTNELNSLCLKAVNSKIVDSDQDYSELEGLTMGEDVLQSIPLLLNADNIAYISESLYNYRINEDSSTNSFKSQYIRDINVVNESKINFLYKINRPELLGPLSKRYIHTIVGQIMNASTSVLSKDEKINYLKAILTSNCYQLMTHHFELPELILPVKITINELNKKRFGNVIKLGKVFNYLWSTQNGIREKIRNKALN